MQPDALDAPAWWSTNRVKLPGQVSAVRCSPWTIKQRNSSVLPYVLRYASHCVCHAETRPSTNKFLLRSALIKPQMSASSSKSLTYTATAIEIRSIEAEACNPIKSRQISIGSSLIAFGRCGATGCSSASSMSLPCKRSNRPVTQVDAKIPELLLERWHPNDDGLILVLEDLRNQACLSSNAHRLVHQALGLDYSQVHACSTRNPSHSLLGHALSIRQQMPRQQDCGTSIQEYMLSYICSHMSSCNSCRQSWLSNG